MKTIEVFAPGTIVSLGIQSVLIVEVCIKEGGSVQYHAVWWDGTTRKPTRKD